MFYFWKKRNTLGKTKHSGEKTKMKIWPKIFPPLKPRGNENEIMKFLGFSKIWDEISLKYISFQIFFFFLE